MANVTMYCTAVCPYCTMAERLLLSKGVTQIDKIRIDTDPAKQAEMIACTGRRTVPQIFIDDYHVGGYDDLAELDQDGGLAPRLAK
ncbi:MAG: glutaredoxin 3 [Sulfuricellaceae bacterium]|nr:glutaredoxin 3 [Sulfuricellaceae bacterium]